MSCCSLNVPVYNLTFMDGYTNSAVMNLDRTKKALICETNTHSFILNTVGVEINGNGDAGPIFNMIGRDPEFQINGVPIGGGGGDIPLEQAIGVPEAGTFSTPPITIVKNDFGSTLNIGEQLNLNNTYYDKTASMVVSALGDLLVTAHNGDILFGADNVNLTSANLVLGTEGIVGTSSLYLLGGIMQTFGSADFASSFSIRCTNDGVASFISANIYNFDHNVNINNGDLTVNGDSYKIRCNEGSSQIFQSLDMDTSFSVQAANGGAATFQDATSYDFDNIVNIQNGNHIQLYDSSNNRFLQLFMDDDHFAQIQGADKYAFNNAVDIASTVKSPDLLISDGAGNDYNLNLDGGTDLHLTGSGNFYINTIGNCVVSSNFSCDNSANINQTLFINGGQITVKPPNNGTQFNINVTNDRVSHFEGSDLISLEDPVRMIVENGSTGSRPVSPVVGQMFWDSTLLIPIFWSGSAWLDSAANPV